MSECRLLVVDQNPESRAVISEALTDQGYVISVAADGDDAIRTLSEPRPSLALVHVEGSTEDNVRTLRRIRDQEPSCPILVVGGGPEVRVVAEQVGAVGYVVDPLDFDDLVATVERVCPLLDDRRA